MFKDQLYQYLFSFVYSLFLISTLPLNGQSPYEISLNKDIPLLGIGITSQVTGIFMNRNVEALSLAQINALTVNEINRFDRKAVENYSALAKTQSDILLFSSYVSPFLLFSGKEIRSNTLDVAVIGAEVFVWTVGLTTITKGLAKRIRPFVYNPEVPLDEKTRRTARLSFFSGHTSTVSSAAFFTAKVFSDFYPESKWKPVIWSAAIVLPSMTGYLRYKAGKHFPTDVITGFAAGALIGILIPQMHKKKNKEKKFTWSVLPVVDGIGLALNW